MSPTTHHLRPTTYAKTPDRCCIRTATAAAARGTAGRVRIDAEADDHLVEKRRSETTVPARRKYCAGVEDRARRRPAPGDRRRGAAHRCGRRRLVSGRHDVNALGIRAGVQVHGGCRTRECRERCRARAWKARHQRVRRRPRQPNGGRASVKTPSASPALATVSQVRLFASRCTSAIDRDLRQDPRSHLVDDLLDAAGFERLRRRLMHAAARTCAVTAPRCMRRTTRIGVHASRDRATCAAAGCGYPAAWCTRRARSRETRCRRAAAAGTRDARSALRRSRTARAQFDAGGGALRSAGRERRAARPTPSYGNFGGRNLHAFHLRVRCQKAAARKRQ